MDKLNYYVLQTDRMLAVYCKDAEEFGDGIITRSTKRAMDCSTSAGLSDDSGSEHDKNDGVESMNEEDDDDDSISAQSDNQNGINDDISDDNDNE